MGHACTSEHVRPARAGTRRGGRRTLRLTALAAAVFVVVPLGGAASADPATQAAVPGSPASVGFVTLVTGDRVHVLTRPDGTQDAVVVPDPADPMPGAYVRHQGGDLVVIPMEALAPLQAGLLDPDLFNVSRLIADGFGDDESSSVPLLLSSNEAETQADAEGDAAAGELARALADAPPAAPDVPAGAAITTSLPALGLTAVDVDKEGAREVWAELQVTLARVAAASPSAASSSDRTAAPAAPADTVAKVWLDGTVHASLDRSVRQIGAPAAYAAGLDGAGVVVAVLDTGLDDQSRDLAGLVVGSANFSGETGNDDNNGHGTHVASTVAGNGAASGGKYKGVAPGARLLDGKVLDGSGSGSESGVLAGMVWAAEQGADVVSMSLGGGPSDGQDPLARAVNRLTRLHGSLFVIAAGNSGDEGTVSSPSTAEAALSVGAVDRRDVVAEFSSKGPRLGDDAIKPEITAPGVDIVAAQAGGTALGEVVAPGYIALSGTSMATPHVSGAAALMLQAHPSWAPATLKSALVSTAKPSRGTPVWHQGVGRVDLAAAVRTSVRVDAGTANLGFFDYPHGGDPVVSRTVTYTNDGAAAATLDLAVTVADDARKAAPAGTLAVSPSRLTLPAGASKTVTLRLTPDLAGIGRWSGLLTATSATGTVLRTAVGFTKDIERYDVTVATLDRAGKPAGLAFVELFNAANGEYVSTIDESPGSEVVRLVPGMWSMAAYVLDDSTDVLDLTLAVQPQVKVTKDATVTLSGRGATRWQAEVPTPGAATTGQTVGYALAGAGGASSSAFSAFGRAALYATPTAPVRGVDFTFGMSAQLRAPALTARVVGATALPLDPIPLWFDEDRLEGRHTYRVVASGASAAATKGALVLVQVKPNTAIDAVVDSAAAAGAAGVVAWTPDRRAFFGLRRAPKIPALALLPGQGQALAARIAAGRVDVDLVGQRFSPYTYDLSEMTKGRVPASLARTYAARDLARIDQTFRSMGAADTGAAARFSTTSISGFVELVPLRLGSRRVDWVTPGGWVDILEAGNVPFEDFSLPAALWLDSPRSYAAGGRRTATWLDPVLRPAASAGLGEDLAVRIGDDVLGYLPPWTDAANRLSLDLPSDTVSWRLSRADGALVAKGAEAFVQARLPRPAAAYVLDLDTSKVGAPTWQRSTSTKTRWAFTSSRTPANRITPLPLMSVDARLPLDLANTAPAGGELEFQVSGRLPAGLPAARVTAMAVETSYDGGRTWVAAEDVERVDADTFDVTVEHPSRRGPVALRVTASAGGGVSVRQEVRAAYALR